MRLEGTPSDQLPDVLATGTTQARYVFVSLSAREPQGRDAEYIAWHSLDHRPEQHRLAGLRNSMRLVSTPRCRAARAASVGDYDAVDHVMVYQFTDVGEMPAFHALGAALDQGGRMPLRLPSLGFMTGELAGTAAAPRAVAGADVMPWRPARGVYVLIEEGEASPASLVEAPGVAGVWWHRGCEAPGGFLGGGTGRQITLCYLDEDPLAGAGALGELVRRRWASGAVRGLLAAPFHTLVPFEWGRYLPTG